MVDMKVIAKMLGVEIGEKFNITSSQFNPYVLTNDGILDCDGDLSFEILGNLLQDSSIIKKIQQDEIEESNQKSDLELLLDEIESNLKTATMLSTFHLGIALKTMQDRLWDINRDLAQRCNVLQNKIFECKGGEG